jgi:hypothetical protein
MIRILLLASLLCSLTFAGCGSEGPELADVSGLVSLDGRPIAGAVLTFRPKFPGGTPSYGGTDENGHYTLNYTDTKAGALIGEYDVDIEPPKKLSRDDIADLKSQGLPIPDQGAIVKIPAKYRGENALIAKVEPGRNTIDFLLDTK